MGHVRSQSDNITDNFTLLSIGDNRNERTGMGYVDRGFMLITALLCLLSNVRV